MSAIVVASLACSFSCSRAPSSTELGFNGLFSLNGRANDLFLSPAATEAAIEVATTFLTTLLRFNGDNGTIEFGIALIWESLMTPSRFVRFWVFVRLIFNHGLAKGSWPFAALPSMLPRGVDDDMMTVLPGGVARSTIRNANRYVQSIPLAAKDKNQHVILSVSSL